MDRVEIKICLEVIWKKKVINLENIFNTFDEFISIFLPNVKNFVTLSIIIFFNKISLTQIRFSYADSNHFRIFYKIHIKRFVSRVRYSQNRIKRERKRVGRWTVGFLNNSRRDVDWVMKGKEGAFGGIFISTNSSTSCALNQRAVARNLVKLKIQRTSMTARKTSMYTV